MRLLHNFSNEYQFQYTSKPNSIWLQQHQKLLYIIQNFNTNADSGCTIFVSLLKYCRNWNSTQQVPSLAKIGSWPTFSYKLLSSSWQLSDATPFINHSINGSFSQSHSSNILCTTKLKNRVTRFSIFMLYSFSPPKKSNILVCY